MFINLLIYNSCNEEKKETICTDVNTLKIPQEIKDRFFFKDSSYWIYRDSISGEIDSCWISNSWQSISNAEKTSPNSKGKCFEGISYELNSLYTNKHQIFINPFFSDLSTPFENESFQIIYSGKYNNNRISFTRISYIGLKLDTFNFEGGEISKLNIVSVKNVTYSDIVYLNYALPSIDIFKRIYYANKVGIIKYEDNKGRVWELIRNKIKQ